MASRTRLLVTCFALAALASVHAAELGDPRVASHIGQPLAADVELTLLEDPATPVQVRVASPEVYNGAGIAVPPVLASLNLSVMRRDGHQFLHVTSTRAVDADHVHLYLELVDKGRRAVRLVTLWLTPDPNPAPPPAPVPTPAPVPATTPAADAALLAQVERARMARAAPAPKAAVAPRPRPARVARAPVLPVAVPVAHPPACVRPAAEVEACAALGAKNDALRARLGQVEERMKKLQATLAAPEARPAPARADVPKESGDKPAPAVPQAQGDKPAPAADEAPKPPVPAGPRPIHSIKPLVPHKAKAPPPPPDTGLPWGWIGAAIGLLALGGAGAVVARRRKAGGGDAEAIGTPGLFEQLKARFAARTRAPEPAEPTLE